MRGGSLAGNHASRSGVENRERFDARCNQQAVDAGLAAHPVGVRRQGSLDEDQPAQLQELVMPNWQCVDRACPACFFWEPMSRAINEFFSEE